MAKHLLNIADIDILFKEKSSKRMSEHMWGNMLANVGKCCIVIDHIANNQNIATGTIGNIYTFSTGEPLDIYVLACHQLPRKGSVLME